MERSEIDTENTASALRHAINEPVAGGTHRRLAKVEKKLWENAGLGETLAAYEQRRFALLSKKR
ncbi:hypothetical protein SARC_08351 [Sphaeroforma arctica JP610]|uniref:Uncharacterized protein n=1 Tax=Sphaeroforma arctica JP610 TaxID=667725 RepID=A0A0L0FRP7_9EUKA|nr:hypothetical protein SARC_08351 [Sphaeroforma arctica JP610]KNC79241.1 hypothetical protein SARC_08351 [Sphaeroforma arctica JP610]|eukprot:XP_014153143.1 hypothetical protein SARC_08351 [Sphaeroforma arctica JP610]